MAAARQQTAVIGVMRLSPPGQGAVALPLGSREILIHVAQPPDLHRNRADHRLGRAGPIRHHVQVSGPGDRIARQRQLGQRTRRCPLYARPHKPGAEVRVRRMVAEMKDRVGRSGASGVNARKRAQTSEVRSSMMMRWHGRPIVPPSPRSPSAPLRRPAPTGQGRLGPSGPGLRSGDGPDRRRLRGRSAGGPAPRPGPWAWPRPG